MDFISAIVLGIIEGITEFLPISSTGHLILANKIFGFPEPFQTTFDIVIQLGAILSVVFYFRDRLFPFGSGRQKEKKTEILSLWKKTLVGVVPALFLGGLFGSIVEEFLFNPWTVTVMLFAGGIVLIIIENREQKPKINSTSELTYTTALYIGLIQTIAMVPGTSRSAATIIGAMLLGASRITAAEFSFFLAIPTMLAASGYSLLKNGFGLTGNEIAILSVGFIVAFVTAYSVIAFFMKFIQTHNFKPFGYYRIVLAVIVIIILYLL